MCLVTMLSASQVTKGFGRACRGDLATIQRKHQQQGLTHPYTQSLHLITPPPPLPHTHTHSQSIDVTFLDNSSIDFLREETSISWFTYKCLHHTANSLLGRALSRSEGKAGVLASTSRGARGRGPKKVPAVNRETVPLRRATGGTFTRP